MEAEAEAERTPLSKGGHEPRSVDCLYKLEETRDDSPQNLQNEWSPADMLILVHKTHIQTPNSPEIWDYKFVLIHYTYGNSL